MAELTYDLAGKTRNKPVVDSLRDVLLYAAKASGVEVVRVTSGGQDAAGFGSRRTGSDRHDYGNAADLELLVGGRKLNFERRDQRPIVINFVTAAAAAGATGIGAGSDYMGPYRLHVGFGRPTYWGADGRRANAPDWLGPAVQAGWANPIGDGLIDTSATHRVIATGSLRMRGGPSTSYGILKTLAPSTKVRVLQHDRRHPEWVLIDLVGDAGADGFVHSGFLQEL